MKTTSIGRQAESKVADYLRDKGYKILGKNWRTRVCEIDIIATKDSIVYFVEVKYRSSDKQGRGFEYITPTKLKKMNFAAEIWIQQHGWDGDYQLLGAQVSENGSINIVEAI